MKKNFIRLVLMLVAVLLLSTPALAQSRSSAQYQEGLHYFLIEDATPAPEGLAEVVEVFSYMC